MAGIYIHIPFCKQACIYCNFYFTTGKHDRNAFVAALHREIELQRSYLSNQQIQTVYFGGGTPSLLSAENIQDIITQLHQFHEINEQAEFTLEANPDDLSEGKLKELKNKTAINRLSIGIQSFRDEDLQLMNRAHNASESFACLEHAQNIGFERISVDLIYGTPGLSATTWRNQLKQLASFQVDHLSCYALTVEEGTKLYHDIRKGKIEAPSAENAAEHFDILVEWAAENGWNHYEISNFSKPGSASRHNTSYWEQKHYLGLGPSAHSYNGFSRQWNVANLKQYTDGLNNGKLHFEKENLSEAERFNEYMMTALRTSKGVNFDYLKTNFPSYLESVQITLTNQGSDMVKRSKNGFCLTDKGKFFADGIASDFFA